MFLSEAKLAAQLNHPNIVQVFDFGQASGHYYLAMEYVDGFNLRTLNRNFRERFGPMPPAACARMISQACEGLSYAHAFKDPQTRKPVNLIHRDISPDNLIISRHGAVKVLDFGIAKAETQTHKTSTGVLKGKMAYMPPEQLQREQLDLRVDVYALGVVLFELLAGALPFDATSEVSIIQAVMKPDPLPPLHELVKDIPPPLDKIVARALAKSRAERYPDCKALQNDLEAYVLATGEKWQPSDLAELVARGEEYDRKATDEHLAVERTAASSSRAQSLGPDGTFVRQPEGETFGTGYADTRMTPVRQSSSKGALFAALGVLLVAAGAGGVLLYLRGEPKTDPLVVAPPPKTAPPVAPVAAPVVDAGGAEVATPAPTPGHPTDDAGAEVATATPTPTPEHPTTPEHPAAPVKAAKHHGEVEVRVRPYAMLYVDGQKIGTTPLDKPLELTAGKHSFRLVNEQYNKDVAVDFTVKPGKQQFKYNLME
jgi:serine/threonine-protein kinase